ncbi:zinc-ribbon domain-containing protein [Roseovarius sp. CAU 1744]|uniref:zinc-ribbon domain-containing protein n=1 Tax=Roseovarius sp. CAU 1744 TaxID=3140368 RepID=UPI00325BF336
MTRDMPVTAAEAMMICNSCDSENPPSARFCGKCGAKIQTAKPGVLGWLNSSATPGWGGKVIIALKWIAVIYVVLALIGTFLS